MGITATFKASSVLFAQRSLHGRRSLPGAGFDPPTPSVCSRYAGSRSDSSPAGTLASPAQAVGRAAAATIPPGAYVLAAQLTDPGSERHSPDASLDDGREPVQISVTGAEALAALAHDPQGSRVDVVVTTEPGPGGGRGRTGLRLAASS